MSEDMKVVSLGTQKPTPKPHGRYKAGDVVQLMSGGVAMTVSLGVGEGMVTAWDTSSMVIQMV